MCCAESLSSCHIDPCHCRNSIRLKQEYSTENWQKHDWRHSFMVTLCKMERRSLSLVVVVNFVPLDDSHRSITCCSADVQSPGQERIGRRPINIVFFVMQIQYRILHTICYSIQMQKNIDINKLPSCCSADVPSLRRGMEEDRKYSNIL